jgi:type IV pilus assembly protein PilC
MRTPRPSQATTSWPYKNTSKSHKTTLKVFKFNFIAAEPLTKKVALSALEAWTRQLAHLLQGGVALSKAVSLIGKTSKNAAIAPLSAHVYNQIVQGYPFGEALRHYPGVSPTYVQLVKAGEQSGTLPLQMERLADQLARQLALRRQLFSALAYPVVVLGVSTCVVMALLWWVVPTMAQLFGDMGAQLPAATQAVLAASHWLQQWGPWVALGLLVLSVAGIWAHRRWAPVRLHLDRALLRLPGWGHLRQLHQQSQWSYSLSTLLQARVPLVDALQSCAQASPPALAFETQAVRHRIVHGHNLSEALETGRGFDGLLVEMARVGEESGLLGTMLFKAAQTQEADLAAWVSRLTALVEPVMVVMLGGVIGSVVLAMYLPMFQMGQLF